MSKMGTVKAEDGESGGGEGRRREWWRRKAMWR